MPNQYEYMQNAPMAGTAARQPAMRSYQPAAPLYMQMGDSLGQKLPSQQSRQQRQAIGQNTAGRPATAMSLSQYLGMPQGTPAATSAAARMRSGSQFRADLGRELAPRFFGGTAANSPSPMPLGNPVSGAGWPIAEGVLSNNPGLQSSPAATAVRTPPEGRRVMKQFQDPATGAVSTDAVLQGAKALQTPEELRVAEEAPGRQLQYNSMASNVNQGWPTGPVSQPQAEGRGFMTPIQDKSDLLYPSSPGPVARGEYFGRYPLPQVGPNNSPALNTSEAAKKAYGKTYEQILASRREGEQAMQEARAARDAERAQIGDTLSGVQQRIGEMTARDMAAASYAPMVNREADRLAARNDRIDAVNSARAGLEERFDGGPIVYKGVTVNPSVAARNLSMPDSRKASLAAQGYEVDPETGVIRRGRQVAPGSGGSIGGSPEQIATQMIAGGYANEDERDAIENRVYESRRRYGMNPSGGDRAPSGVERSILARTDLTDQQKGIYLGARAARMKSRGRPLSPMAEALTMGAIDVASMPGYNRGVDSAPMTMPSAEEAASNIAAMDAAAANPQVAAAGPQTAAAAAAAVPDGATGRTGLSRDARSPSVSYNITVGDYFNKSLGEQMDLRNRRMNIAAANGNPIAQRLLGNLRSQQAFDQQMDPTQPQDFKSRMELMRFENEMATAAQDRQLAAEARDYDRKMKEYKIAVDAGADPAEAAKALGLGGSAFSVKKNPYPSAEDVRRTGIEQGMNYAQINQGISQRDAMEKLDAKRASGDPDAAKVTSIRPSTLPQESTAYERVEDFINRLAGVGYKGFGPDQPNWFGRSTNPNSQAQYRDYVAESPDAFPPAETFLEAAAAEGISPADLREYYTDITSWKLGATPASGAKAAYYLAGEILKEQGDAPRFWWQNPNK